MAVVEVIVSAPLVQIVILGRIQSATITVSSASHSPPQWPFLLADPNRTLVGIPIIPLVFTWLVSASASYRRRTQEERERMRHPIYELLYLLNRNLQETRDLLARIQKSPRITKDKFKAYLTDVEYLRAEATQDVLEVMNDVEIDEMARWSREKKAYEDSVRDLDDVYFEVQDREEQRRQQGLPSLIGILPRSYQGRSATSRDEAKQESESSEPALPLNARNREKRGATRPDRFRSKDRNSARRRPSRGTGGGRDGKE